MKRCPRCNQEFIDDWLTFCTADGTSLVVVEGSSTEPPPTLVAPPMPPSVSPLEQPTLDFPGSEKSPPAPYVPPQSSRQVWAPPPPPSYATAPQQSLAVASLVLGMISMTLGWCCSFGVLTAPLAIALGIYSLVQIKNNPTKYTGKGFAIGGIVTGGLYFLLMGLLILLYGLGALLGGLS